MSTLRNFNVSFLSLAAILVIIAMLSGSEIHAQNKSGNTVGAPSGAVGGGSSGASNRGGAGGISNPSPGGSPSSLGDPGQNSGPRSTETARPGYLGGRTTEVNPPPVNPTETVTTITVNQFGRCPAAGGMRDQHARLSGNNIGRIDAVSRYLTRGPKQAVGPDTHYLLAGLQEELQKTRPDLTLAGTYLGIVSRMAVTPALATDVSQSLCSPISPEAAEQIAAVAEAQRRKLAKER